ncbi:MAG: hypothetical protein HY038_06385 [Nitrospirae bacterium]|nr:hypothetical protein [Nitrospirota bacterium]
MGKWNVAHADAALEGLEVRKGGARRDARAMGGSLPSAAVGVAEALRLNRRGLR